MERTKHSKFTDWLCHCFSNIQNSTYYVTSGIVSDNSVSLTTHTNIKDAICCLNNFLEQHGINSVLIMRNPLNIPSGSHNNLLSGNKYKYV